MKKLTLDDPTTQSADILSANIDKLKSLFPEAFTEPNRVVLYHAADGKVTVNVFFARDNFWLPQRAIADLFGVRIAAISKHLKNTFDSGELSPEATVSKMETVQTEDDRSRAHPRLIPTNVMDL